MRVAIIGANGQLGTDLVKAMADWDVVPLTHDDVEVCDHTATRRILERVEPAVVINTAAYNRVDDCEDEVGKAFAVNAFAVRNLAQICADLDSVFVHISTNYVFDGRKREPYTEDDVPNPLSVYGVSKLAGEHFARNICDQHLIIRTSGLYGIAAVKRGNSSFVETILRQASAAAPLRVVTDQVSSPSYAEDVALRIIELLQAGQWGTFHVTNSGACSWYEFAQATLRATGKPNEIQPVTSEEFGARARRPRNGVLVGVAAARLGLAPLRSWQEALAAYVRERAAGGA